MSRSDGRAADELRPIRIEPGFIDTAHGSVLFSIGKTRVVCTAMVEESVPPWMRGRGTGWITSEYGMLPGSTSDRKQRDASRGKQDGRTVEIQRLIGRSLRSVVDFKGLGERTVWIDCDVLQADGGTRCAAICGGYVALQLALTGLVDAKRIRELPLTDSVAAVSVGIVDGVPLLDLPYEEDSRAEVDMNVVLSGQGRLIEVQATAERTPFGRTSLDELLGLAVGGIEEIAGEQTRVLHEARSRVG
ncbi:MAG: ribonuclease [Gaiellales bacterium]|jgi:ribonuclease PH|nr:ribonuclease [Gaiellales bacterium]MDX6593018.1 ribonuclease [Gaiellales bacterium]